MPCEMKFPVDLLADVSLAELERSAHNYMNNLLYSNPDSPEHLTTSASTKVIIDISSVGFVPLYGSDDTWKILALFSPSDPFIAVGLYLLDRWWAVEDILKTADPARDGVLEVETVGDRIVLYILNRVIYRGKEMTSDELPFLCHGKKDYAKIVWNNGEAVGFYSVKPSGTICNSFSVRTYQLSVMDSIFVRKCQRRKGFGLQMLVDFVLSFKEESLGLRYPVTKSMYKVCEKYLCQYPGDADLLWEVESIGGPKQRTNIARKIMAIDISVSKSLSFSEESLLTPDVAEKVLKETTAVECSVETMVQEEVTVLRATKEIDDVPVVSQRRSSHTKQRITGEKMKEDKSEKTIRIEEIEAETPRKEQVSVQRKTELHDSQELEQTEVSLSVFKEKAGDVVDTVSEGGPTMRSNKPATVLTSGDLAEDHVTSATMTEEEQVEDDATQDLNNKSHDSQITVENVASETQEAEVCEKEEEADIPFGGDAEENILPVELDEEMSWRDEETPANEEQVQGGYGEGKTVIESRVLRSGKKTVRATARIKTTKRQDDEQEEEADGVNTKGDKPAEDGVVREGRWSAATARQQSKQAQEETTVTEEVQVDKTKAVLEEAEEINKTRDQKNEDNNEEEAAVQKNENPEPEVEIEQVEAVEGVSLREQDTAEEEQSVASVTCADREEVASIQECAEETPDEGKVPSDEDAVADETTTVHQAADEAEEESTEAKEIHIAETKDSITEEIEEKDGEEDASQKDDTEDTLKTNVENVNDEIEAPAVESRVLRCGGKPVTTTPVSKTTKRGHKQNTQVEMLVEKSADTDELAVETRILRKGRRSAPATSRRKSKRARIQCQPEEQSDEETVPAEEMEGEEGEVGQESPEKNREKAEEGGKIMEMEIKPSNDAEQGEAESAPGEVEDSILPKSAPDSTVFSLSEEEAAPSAEEQQNEEMVCPISGLQGLTVVSVNMKENLEVHKETAATEEAVSVEKIADEAEEEQSEETMKQEKTMPEEQFHDSSMEIEKTEIVKGIVEEKVEDAVIMEDTGEGSTEETGGENNTKSDDEQNSTVNETRTLRGRKKQVTAPTGHESVRVLRSGRKSVLVTQTCTRKSTHKQIQKEESEEGEESPSVEGTDLEEEAEQTSVIDQEKGEIIENDTSQQEETPAPEMDIENMNTVAEEAVTQDVPAVGQADSTETITDEDAEALVGEADEGMTSDVVEKEAVTGPETVEAEESTSEVEETAAGENSENKLLTSNDDHKEETPVTERRVLTSGTPKITATPQKTMRSRKKADEQEAKNTKKEKSAVTPITPRQGRKSANAPPKDESRRTLKQVQEEGQKGDDEPEGLETTGLGDELNATKEPVVEKTDEEIEGENLKEIEKHKVEAASEKIEYLDLSVGVEEGKAVEDEQTMTEEGTIPVTEEENIATVPAAAGVLVQEEETDTLLLNPATDSATFSLNEEEAAPSSKKQQSAEMASQAFGLQRLTVVLVDMKKNVEVLKETAATEEAVSVEKIADEVEEEQSEETMKQEKTMPEEQFHDSSMEIEKTEIVKGIVEEEGLEEKVEDAVIMEDTGEGSTEETGGENNTKSDDEQNSTVNETRTPRGRKKPVTAPTGHESVRVLRSGRKSVLVTQTCTRKSTHKQIQKEESEEGEESPSVEGTDLEEEAEQTSVINQEKGEIIENDASQQEETPAPEMDIENMNTVAEEAVTQDVPVVGQADSTETITDEDAEALVGEADEGMTSDVVEKEAVTGPETVEAEESTSEVEETAAGKNSENKLLTSNDDHNEETPVVESRVLRSGKKTVRATTRIKTTKRQDDEQEEEADGVNTKGDKPAEDGVVREQRRSAATARQQSKQAQEETTVTEEVQVDKTKVVLEGAEEIKETRDRKNEDNNEEEAAARKNENPEPEVEIEQVEAVEGVSLREQDTAEEEQSVASVTCADREEVAFIQECAEETPDEGKVPSDEDAVADETTTVHQAADEAEEESIEAKEIHIAETKDSITEEIEEKDGEEDASQKDDTEDTLKTNVENVTDEIKAPAVESRVLRCGGKLVTTTPVSKTTKRGHKQNTQVEMLVEKSADTDELAVETRILRKGRRSAPATSRRKSKRARIQCQPEEQSDEETVPAEEMEGEEGEVGQESPEKNREKAEEGGRIMEMEIKPSNDAEQGEAESAPGGEYLVADTEQMKDSMIEETALLEGDRGDNSKTDLVETDIIQISSAEVEETNSIEEEGIRNIEKSTPVTEVVSDTAIAEEEAQDEGAHEVAEEDAPAATTMSLRSKTNTSHPKLTRRSRGQKTQEPVETKPQQMEEEDLEDVETQEVPPMTDNSPEQREQKEEQTDAEETSATGHEADEDIADYIDKETSDSRVVESLGDDTQSVDEDKDNMTDDFSDNQHIKKLKEGSEEENLENAVKAGEKGSILNSTLDTDEEVETPGVSQKQENDEQNMSEEEMESILIGKRVLRSRIVPSVIITPHSKSRRRSTKVQIAEESSSDEETSPQSSKRRSLRKRKSTAVTPAHKFKRSSRVQEVLQ